MKGKVVKMDMSKYFKRTKLEEIHNELFEQTTEHKYYTLGLARGLVVIYHLVNKYDKLSSDDIANIIRRIISNEKNEEFERFFNELLEDEE